MSRDCVGRMRSCVYCIIMFALLAQIKSTTSQDFVFKCLLLWQTPATIHGINRIETMCSDCDWLPNIRTRLISVGNGIVKNQLKIAIAKKKKEQKQNFDWATDFDDPLFGCWLREFVFSDYIYWIHQCCAAMAGHLKQFEVSSSDTEEHEEKKFTHREGCGIPLPYVPDKIVR